MTSIFRTLTPAIAVIATLAVGAAQAQNSTTAAPAATTTAPAVTAKSGEAAPAGAHKKHVSETKAHKADGQSKPAKKMHDTLANQNNNLIPRQEKAADRSFR